MGLVALCRNPLLVLPAPGKMLVWVRRFDPRLLLAYRVHDKGRTASGTLG